jgi:hypothetical protein
MNAGAAVLQVALQYDGDGNRVAKRAAGSHLGYPNLTGIAGDLP